MPGFDRTGPRSEGPMTGGARGRCNPNSQNNSSDRIYGLGRGGMPRGGGRGWGRGQGLNRWNAPFDRNPYEQQANTPVDEKKYLVEELADLETRVKGIKDRLDELKEKK